MLQSIFWFPSVIQTTPCLINLFYFYCLWYMTLSVWVLCVCVCTCDHFCRFFEIGFPAIYTWLAWNSLCQSIWPQTLGQSSWCHVFNTGITSCCQYNLWIFNQWCIIHFKNSTDSWAWFHMSLIKAFRSQRKLDLCESQPSLVYRASPRITRDTKTNNVSKIKKNQLLKYLKENIQIF